MTIPTAESSCGRSLRARTTFWFAFLIAATTLVLTMPAGHFWLPLLATAAIALAANAYQFGSPFDTGYTQWQSNGIPHVSPSPANLPVALHGFFFGVGKNCALHFPVFALALFGYLGFVRKYAYEELRTRLLPNYESAFAEFENGVRRQIQWNYFLLSNREDPPPMRIKFAIRLKPDSADGHQ